jgi:putative FmdB family regulatory protein
MPIYAYRCEACGFAKDALQKIADAPLTECPSCGKSAFKKQLTAAGFQLKGSGWYVTDFRGGASNAAAPPGHVDSAASAKSDSTVATATTATTATATPAAPAGGTTPTAS